MIGRGCDVQKGLGYPREMALVALEVMELSASVEQLG